MVDGGPVRAPGRPQPVGSVRVLVVAVVVLATAFALLVEGVRHPDSASSAPARHPPAQTATGAAATIPTVRTVTTVPTVRSSGPMAPPHVSLTASGPSSAGRTFAYGYDLVRQVPKSLAIPSAQGAVQVAQSEPGGFAAVPIMGWGVGNPELSPGTYDFSGIARQLSFVQAAGEVPVITLCAAPDWMKGGAPGTTDWSNIQVAPLSQHYGDFAALSAAVARSFPQVRYFVVWNELKGFWNPATGVTDIGGYTAMYNDTFRAIKAARPDALVGGPYIAMHSMSGPAPASAPTPWGTWGHLGAGPLWEIAYWLANKAGADFVAVDGRSFTNDAGLTTDPVSSTAKYAAVDRWLETQTSLPIVWMESHVLPDPTTSTLDQQTAVRVAALLEMASSGASVGLQWDPEQFPTWDEGLWSPAGAPGGGQATPLARTLPAVLNVLAAPVTLVAGTPAGTLVATGADGTVTVTYSATTASVTVTGPLH